MRLAYGQIRSVDRETLINCKQLGIDRVHFNLPYDLKARGLWEYHDLYDFVDRCGNYDVIIEGMENLPIPFYDKAMLGEVGRDRQIENVCESIRNLGRVGIHTLGYHFSPSFVWRTSNRNPSGRFGAKVQSFDLELQKQGIDDMADFGQRREVPVEEEQLWENFMYFMDRVIPVAEEYGVKMALHPDDPPIKKLSGISRLFTDIDSYKKADALIRSDYWGILFCIGTFSQMSGGASNVFNAIEYFGNRGKLIYAHMRDVQGTVPAFQECFLGEGNLNPAQVIKSLMDANFDGFIISDHVPYIEGDSDWGHRVRYADTAYMKGVIEGINLNNIRRDR